jgi:hypothetical protein
MREDEAAVDSGAVAWRAGRSDALVVDGADGPLVSLSVDHLSGEPEAGDRLIFAGHVRRVKGVDLRRRSACLTGETLPGDGGAVLAQEASGWAVDDLRALLRGQTGGPVEGKRHV